MSENNKYLVIVAKVASFQEAIVEGKQGTKPIGIELSVSKHIPFGRLRRFIPDDEAYFMLEWNDMGHKLFKAMQKNYKELSTPEAAPT